MATFKLAPTKKIQPLMQGTPISTSAAIISQYRKRLDRLVKMMTDETNKKMESLFKSGFVDDYFEKQDDLDTDATVAVMDAKSPASQSRIILAKLETKYGRLFDSKGKDYTDDMVTKSNNSNRIAVNASLKQLGGMPIKTKLTTNGITEELKAHTLWNSSLITNIADDYFNKISGVVVRSISGGGAFDIKKELLKIEGVTKRRAKHIAEDQTRKLWNNLNEQRFKSSGITKFKWNHSGAGQVPRPDHVAMDGNIYSFDDLPVIDQRTGERGIPGQDEIMTIEKIISPNGWVESRGVPITKEGVFEYPGYKIHKDLIKTKLYKVYRPASALQEEECIESFKLLPVTEDHFGMVGTRESIRNDTRADVGQAGVQGTTGEEIYFTDGFLNANVKPYTQKMYDSLENGKKQLSIGYTCKYTPYNGIFNGESYEFIQTDIRGNHVAYLYGGRSGPEIAMDSSEGHEIGNDFFKITLDSGEQTMPIDVKAEDTAIIGKAEDETLEVKTEDAEGEKDALNGMLTMDMVRSVVKEMIQESLATMNSEKPAEELGMDKDVEVNAMDAIEKIKSDFTSLKTALDSQADQLTAYKKDGIKTLTVEIGKRDDLARCLTSVVGSFDSAAMDLSDVARYGAKELKLNCPEGHEVTAVESFLKAKTPNVRVALDSAKDLGSNEQLNKFMNRGT
jgi:hypothetical protein